MLGRSRLSQTAHDFPREKNNAKVHPTQRRRSFGVVRPVRLKRVEAGPVWLKRTDCSNVPWQGGQGGGGVREEGNIPPLQGGLARPTGSADFGIIFDVFRYLVRSRTQLAKPSIKKQCFQMNLLKKNIRKPCSIIIMFIICRYHFRH